jgi:hypothetical protein
MCCQSNKKTCEVDNQRSLYGCRPRRSTEGYADMIVLRRPQEIREPLVDYARLIGIVRCDGFEDKLQL